MTPERDRLTKAVMLLEFYYTYAPGRGWVGCAGTVFGSIEKAWATYANGDTEYKLTERVAMQDNRLAEARRVLGNTLGAGCAIDGSGCVTDDITCATLGADDDDR